MPKVPASEWFFFDEREQATVREVLETIRSRSTDQHKLLSAHLQRLRAAAELIRQSPSITSTGRYAWQGPASGEGLIELLSRMPDYDLDLRIPTKAVLGQAYLIAKINFFKTLMAAIGADGTERA